MPQRVKVLQELKIMINFADANRDAWQDSVCIFAGDYITSAIRQLRLLKVMGRLFFR